MPDFYRSPNSAREHEMTKRARTAALRAREPRELVIESVYLGEVETMTRVGKEVSFTVAPLSVPRVRWLEREPA